MRVIKESFGKTKNGNEVKAYKMMAKDGSYVTILNYGLIIQKIVVPDKNGKLENIVLGFDDIATYEEATSYYGAIIGRYSGRLAGGRFEIDGKTYETAKQNGKVTLHGGLEGFDKKKFDCEAKESGNEAILECSYISSDGEEGFPGELDLKVIFTFTENKEFTIRYIATTNKDTIVNLTSHSYFNLGGKYQTIYDQKLYVNANEIMTFDENQAPNGFEAIIPAVDFNEMRRIGDTIFDESLEKTRGVDHIFKLKKDKDVEVVLIDEESGRKIEVETTGRAVVIYTQNFLDEINWVYDKIKLKRHCSVCLETQDFPNAINIKGYERVLRVGETYDESTVYKFGIV